MSGIGALVRTAAYLAAAILVIWLLLDLVDASPANSFVHWFEQAARWLATWSLHLFDSVRNGKVRALLVFGVPALVYAAVGQGMGRATSR
ncbi:hypothetical protein [Streptacidiphilus monticola]|jgi:hypothetical protein|uniref:Uncharacterized protein n=1 Tax=Streptacidiphilus monticola TaxID=2161674 RepID=A0ABW1G6Z4_9ACTN